MKLNKITTICLVSAALLLGSILVVQAVGFVSYEDEDKVIFWDNVRIVDKGLKMSDMGVNDLEMVDGGRVKIVDRDLYVRKYMGFNCPNYPQVACNILIGDLGGNTFLRIDELRGDSLNLKSTNSNISLSGVSVNFTGKLILTDNKNLGVGRSIDSGTEKSVFTNTLKANEISGNIDLSVPNLRFETMDDGIKFQPLRIINLAL
ncbi:MAG TPA: hypothetical protein ENN28_01490 [Candidatus Uhrbacteria bacterium]|nr:hypothetical protein [Candidatus Uhrbacteria bacterium]